MAVNRVALIGLSVLGLTATFTIALAQNKNTSNPMKKRKYHQSDTERKYGDPTAPSSYFSSA